MRRKNEVKKGNIEHWVSLNSKDYSEYKEVIKYPACRINGQIEWG